MKTLKKISPLEFRLHSKKFVTDYTPLNYFEKLRFTILFSRLLFWFFRRYGLYIFSYKLRMLEEQFLFQFFYYRTRQNKRYFKSIWWRKFSRVVIPFRAKRKKRRRKYRKIWKFLTPGLFKKKITKLKKKVIRRKNIRSHEKKLLKEAEQKLRLAKFYRLHEQVLYMFRWQRRHFRKYQRQQIFKTTRPIKVKKVRYWPRKTLKNQNFNFFFIYFFLHFFKLRSYILYKSLYRYLISNRHFKEEHFLVLKRMGYLQDYNWAFDFLFLFHSAINFINFDFILPFFIYQVKRSYKQRPFINILFNLIKYLYFLKTNIYGIKVLVHGPYDRHGRSRTLLFRLGTVSLTSYRSFILYDTAQWPTFYGAIQIKLWILYSVPYYAK